MHNAQGFFFSSTHCRCPTVWEGPLLRASLLGPGDGTAKHLAQNTYADHLGTSSVQLQSACTPAHGLCPSQHMRIKQSTYQLYLSYRHNGNKSNEINHLCISQWPILNCFMLPQNTGCNSSSYPAHTFAANLHSVSHFTPLSTGTTVIWSHNRLHVRLLDGAALLATHC